MLQKEAAWVFELKKGSSGHVFIGESDRRDAQGLWSDSISSLILNSKFFGWICKRSSFGYDWG
jgi:hypothetical protein